MRNILVFTGILLGLILCVLEGIVSYSDTSPLDQEFGIEIISWKFFTLKLIVYSTIGGVLGYLICKIINNLKNKTK
ncbi:hypothetical protein SL053_002122 [Flavobacterium psychrophilum]|nr:hypothetical protein [Flavobacterium psychrophilum]